MARTGGSDGATRRTRRCSRTAAPDTIEATLNYIVDDGTKVFTIVAAPGGSDTRSGGTPDPRRVQIHNGRPHADDFALDRNGFRFLRHDTKVADFYDEDEIKRVYYPEMEALIKAESGAKRVVVFDHTLRTADSDLRQTPSKSAKSSAACTTTIPNGRRRSACAISCPTRPRNCSSAASPSSRCGARSAIRSKLFRWRMADAQSLSPSDMIVSERRSPGRIGQTYAIKFNPKHKWFWFPRMRREEAYVFKVFDSEKDGRARWTAHTAFDDPTSPPNARPRESIEIRTLAFF